MLARIKGNKNRGVSVESSSRFSWKQLSVFGLFFGAIGVYFLFQSFAATVVPWGSFEAGNLSEFSDSWCNGKKVITGTSPVREGKYAALFQADQTTQCYGDTANTRVHMLGFPAGKDVPMNNGDTFWWAVSLYIPSSNQNTSRVTLPEIHQSNSGTNCYGPAPFNMNAVGGRWQFVLRGSDDCKNSAFTQYSFGAPNSTCNNIDRFCKSFTNGSDTLQTDQWYDFLLGFKMAPDSTGWFEAWMNGPTTGGKSVNVVPRTNAPTTYPAPNYPILSIYYPLPNNAITKTYYDGGAFSSDFGTLRDWQNTFTKSWATNTPATPTPTVSLSSSPQSVALGGTSKLTWSSQNTTSCAASGGWSGSLATSGSFTTSSLSATTTYTISCTGPGGSANASTTVTASSTTGGSSGGSSGEGGLGGSSQVTATSSIKDGDILTGPTQWTVTTSGPAGRVDYFVNGVKAGSVTKANATSFVYSLDAALYPNATNGGYDVFDANGTQIYSSPTIVFTVKLPATPPPVSVNSWTAQYYDNQDLSNLKITRIDPRIDFNWASGTSPDISIASTTYSARWQGNFNFEAATYAFTVKADDGVRVYLDNALMLDKWFDQYPTTYTFTKAATAGTHTMKVEYFNSLGGGVANIQWAKQVAAPVGTGLTAAYFDNANLTNAKSTRLDSLVNFSWGQGAPVSGMGGDTFSARWTGRLLAPTSGTYTLSTYADDGVRLWLDNNLVINDWTNHAAAYRNATVNLSQGQFYSIKLEYYENKGQATAKLLWTTPGGSQVLIPTSQLFPN